MSAVAASSATTNGSKHDDADCKEGERRRRREEEEEEEDPGRWRWRAARALLVLVLVLVVSAGMASTTASVLSAIFGPPPEVASNISATLSSGFDEFYASNVQPLLDMGSRSLDGGGAGVGVRVGTQLRSLKARAKHPVVLIPGFTSSGLELWEGHDCLKGHFRQRLWGGTEMAKAFLADSECWRRHLMLDPRTGMDPENVRVRAAQGFAAADNFVGAYWVWAKIIENLADVGYDRSTMTMMSYDWRLGFEHLETRDGYFTRLRHAIEGHREVTGHKAVVVSHSMGGLVTYYFLQWVVADVKVGGGGGGRDWVENHVHAFVNIAGPMLGVPKAIPALLSGELGDTAAMFPQLGDLLEKYFGRRWRRNLWMTWGSLFGMLPRGGDAIWGVGADLRGENGGDPRDGGAGAGDGAPAAATTTTTTRPPSAPAIVWHNGTGEICPAVAATVPPGNATPATTVAASSNDDDPIDLLSALDIHPSRTWSFARVIDYLLRTDGGGSSSIYSFDAKKGWKTRASSVEKRRHWHDPTATGLPKAPSMNIYCLYGVGIETERSYYYRVSCDKIGGGGGGSDEDRASCPREDEDETRCGADPPEAPFLIDTAARDDSRHVQSGVRTSDGDATVPLLSLGYMCRKWAQPGRNMHNPSGIGVYTRERRHEARVSLSDPGRSGPAAGEHVDILGNAGVIEDVIRIATGFEVEEKVNEDIIVSDLRRIVQTIDEHSL